MPSLPYWRVGPISLFRTLDFHTRRTFVNTSIIVFRDIPRLILGAERSILSLLTCNRKDCEKNRSRLRVDRVPGIIGVGQSISQQSVYQSVHQSVNNRSIGYNFLTWKNVSFLGEKNGEKTLRKTQKSLIKFVTRKNVAKISSKSFVFLFNFLE